MTEIIAQTGEVKTGGRSDVLKSSPIGSCVVVVLFDEDVNAGGMAHIMLPGKAPEKKGTIPERYAENAIKELLLQMAERGASASDLKAVIAGGGNVLKREGDMIGKINLSSVSNLLGLRNIPIVAREVGGTNRKSVRFDIQEGIIYCTKGDEKERMLFDLSHKNQ